MLLKLSFQNQQHCDPLTPQTIDKFISKREIFAFLSMRLSRGNEACTT